MTLKWLVHGIVYGHEFTILLQLCWYKWEYLLKCLSKTDHDSAWNSVNLKKKMWHHTSDEDNHVQQLVVCAPPAMRYIIPWRIVYSGTIETEQPQTSNLFEAHEVVASKPVGVQLQDDGAGWCHLLSFISSARYHVVPFFGRQNMILIFSRMSHVSCSMWLCGPGVSLLALSLGVPVDVLYQFCDDFVSLSHVDGEQICIVELVWRRIYQKKKHIIILLG
jgi:hypothetical protein